MKKVVIVFMLLLFSPHIVLADSQNEEFLSMLEEIKNVQVEEDTRIVSVEVEHDFLMLKMEEEERIQNKKVYYSFDDSSFSFYSADANLEDDKLEIHDNQSAFYLYSILESKSNAPYQEEHYYNTERIQKIWDNLSSEEKVSFCSKDIKSVIDQDLGKTFGIELSSTSSEGECHFIISYQYYFDGENTISLHHQNYSTFEERTQFTHFITILLILGILLATYSFYDFIKKRK